MTEKKLGLDSVCPMIPGKIYSMMIVTLDRHRLATQPQALHVFSSTDQYGRIKRSPELARETLRVRPSTPLLQTTQLSSHESVSEEADEPLWVTLAGSGVLGASFLLAWILLA